MSSVGSLQSEREEIFKKNLQIQVLKHRLYVVDEGMYKKYGIFFLSAWDAWQWGWKQWVWPGGSGCSPRLWVGTDIFEYISECFNYFYRFCNKLSVHNNFGVNWQLTFPFHKHFFLLWKILKLLYFYTFRAGSGHYTSYARHEGRDPWNCLTKPYTSLRVAYLCFILCSLTLF